MQENGADSPLPKIAVVALGTPTKGGIYQYTRSIISAAINCEYTTKIYYIDKSWRDSDLYDPDNWERVSLIGRAARLGLRQIFRSTGLEFEILGSARQWLAPKLRLFNPELVVYPNPNPMAFETGIPYIISIHDVQYKLNPQFPEVGSDEIIKGRSYTYENGSEYATGVFVDSETGKEDVLRFFDINEDRVYVLPFVPPDYLDEGKNEIDTNLLEKLPDRYLFYPAQFWKHKNHVTLLEAIAKLRDDEGLEIPCVFVGGKKNAYQEVKNTIERHELHDLVYELGLVENDKMYTLYKGAEALVMPTYFGPTNIPPMEAFKLGCPVITSDVHGLPEQVGDAALLVDPDSEGELASAIESIWTDAQLRQTLIERGYQKTASYSQNDFNELFEKYVHDSISSR